MTDDIANTGANAIGMDLSVSMIEKERSKYPEIDFFTGNAEDFRFDEKFDAVFSNAALHWMKKAKEVVECVWNVLI